MRQLKVLIITSKYPRYKDDPQPSFTYYLARELVKESIKVTVISPHDNLAKEYENLGGIEVHRFKYFYPARFQKLAYGGGIPENIKTSFLAKTQIPLFLISQIIFCKRLIKKINPDIIHVHWAIPQALTASLLNKPYIVTIYGGEVFLSKKLKLIKLLNHLIKKSKSTFAITNSLRNIMYDFGVKEKVGVIPLGVDTKKFKPNIKGWQAVRKKYCKKNDLLILSVSRLVEKKGTIYLIEAFAKVLKKIPNCKLVIVGDGYLYDSLVKRTKELKIYNKVIFTKEIGHKELPKYYCASDLFVLPSIIDRRGDRETQGVVYLEAMACKCPVIGTNTGGIVDVITDNKTGKLVPQKDSNSLSEEMINLLKNKNIKKRYTDNAYKKVIKEFSWSSIAKQYISKYKKYRQI